MTQKIGSPEKPDNSFDISNASIEECIGIAQKTKDPEMVDAMLNHLEYRVRWFAAQNKNARNSSLRKKMEDVGENPNVISAAKINLRSRGINV